ncbi:hypothetical protein LENED_011176 [Lentinula edodes]|uniref:Uncharacterized protein n=1 Tax=Lentinula edodes TaxID=5353 RepID=A0A1Q3EPA6_LENED|nr:hypothetical protein LENED_011176 [Lentinula edodes]
MPVLPGATNVLYPDYTAYSSGSSLVLLVHRSAAISNVESSSDPDIRTIGALSHPTQIVVPVDSHSVMEARSGNISEGWHEVGSDEDDDEKWEEIHHPGQAPGHPTKSTAAAHPEPPRTVANVPKQKPKAPERKNSLVSLLSYTWDGIKTGRIGDNEVSLMDTLIHDEAVDLIDQAAKYKWKLTNYLINHQNPYMYPAAAHPDTMNTTEFKFLLKLEYDYGGKGKNYSRHRRKQSYRSKRLVQLSRLRVVEWDAQEARLIKTPSGHLLMPLLPRLELLFKHAVVDACHQNHRRGKYPTLPAGCGFGGGRTLPGNHADTATMSVLIDAVLSDTAVQRVARVIDASFKLTNPSSSATPQTA